MRKEKFDMVKVNCAIENKKNLGERCRVALEKSYGMQVPMPKCLGKKRHRFLSRVKV